MSSSVGTEICGSRSFLSGDQSFSCYRNRSAAGFRCSSTAHTQPTWSVGFGLTGGDPRLSHGVPRTSVLNNYSNTSGNLPSGVFGRYHYNNMPDPAALYLLRQELLKTSSDPFMGDPTKFKMWASLLQRRMMDIPIDPIDKLSIIIANTGGEPRKLVEDLMVAGMRDPQKTYERAWEALSQRHGSPIHISFSLKKKLDSFPSIKPPNLKCKLHNLLHLCYSIEANMQENSELLVLFNLASGQQSICTKFPERLQLSWRTYGHNFTIHNFGQHPPLSKLVGFLCSDKVEEMCSPNFETLKVETTSRQKPFERAERRLARSASAFKIEEKSFNVVCAHRKKACHSLMDCKTFAKLPYAERKKFVRNSSLCFRCLGEHFSRACTVDVTCSKCSGRHCYLMHQDRTAPISTYQNPKPSEQEDISSQSRNEPHSFCTAACGNVINVKYCSKNCFN